jgi:ADP-ribosyl-[dinitrogen reductase] hydrolase
MLWELLAMKEAPEPHWWPRRYVELARDLEGEKNYLPRGGRFTDFRGSLWHFVEERAETAYDAHLTSLKACDSWYSGAYLLETVPSGLFILMRHAEDPEEAIVRAVNDTRDNDTVAAIVGAAVGALHGVERLPERWLRGLKGRTRADDDGECQRILERARRRWWEAGETER